MRGRFVTVALALLVSSCSQPLDADAVLDAFDGSDDPILVVTQVCYSICAAYEAYPSFAVYADRTMVAVTPTGPDRRLEATRHTLDDATAQTIAGLMVDGGLIVGGVRATATNHGIADGGGVVFETLLDGEPGYVHAPFLESEPVTPDRTALSDLVALLDEVASRDGAEDLPVRWVAIGQRLPEPNMPAWPGDERPSGEPPCFVLDSATVPVELAPMLPSQNPRTHWFRFGNVTHVISARPLLPHESGCNDARAMLERFAQNDAGLDLGGTG